MPRRRGAPRDGPAPTGLDKPGVVDTILTRDEPPEVVLVVQVPRPWEAADGTRLKKKIAGYLEFLGDDGLSDHVADWPDRPTTIAVHAAEPPPDAFAPLWERYAYTLREQYGLGFELDVLQGANAAAALVRTEGFSGHDAHGAMRGGMAFAAHVAAGIDTDEHGPVEIVDARTLRVDPAGAARTLNLDNAWREARGKGAPTLERVVQHYLRLLDDAGEGDGVDADHVVPAIRAVAWLEELQAQRAQQGDLVAPVRHEPFAREIVLTYVFDLPDRMAFLSPEEGDDLAATWAGLHDLAVGNLWRALRDDLQVHQMDEGVFMVTAGGDHEAALLCVAPLWARLAGKVAGDVVAAVPARDLLLFAGADDARGLDTLRMRAQELFETADHAIAPGLLRLTRAGWTDM